MTSKITLRNSLKSQLNLVSNNQQIELDSRAICSKLLEYINNSSFSSILAYNAHFKGEIQLDSLFDKLDKTIKIYLPKVTSKKMEFFLSEDSSDYSKGAFGIKEPISSKKYCPKEDSPSLIIIPGLAFSKSKDRLGRGLGCYDKFLSTLPHNSEITKVGVCLKSQILDEIPTETHDQKMDIILTI